jgi:hypothetical protein
MDPSEIFIFKPCFLLIASVYSVQRLFCATQKRIKVGFLERDHYIFGGKNLVDKIWPKNTLCDARQKARQLMGFG